MKNDKQIIAFQSKKVEPFKMWFAKVGYERMQDVEDSEAGIQIFFI